MTAAPGRPGSLRLLLAAGDRERERSLASELAGLGVEIVARCLDAPSLLERDPDDVDAALVAAGLHRLSPAVLRAVRERGLPVALLSGDVSDSERYGGLARVLPAAADAREVAAALVEIARRGPVYEGASLFEGLGEGGTAPARASAGGTVVAVTSGKGAPGKTTLAISLAAALSGRGLQVALADFDLRGGNVAPCLDLDPRRGLVGLQTADPGPAPGRVAEELQDGPGFSVLAGIERPGLGAGLREETLPVALSALRELHDRVVVDLPGYGTGERGSRPDSVLRAADLVLLVAGPDPVSLWNAWLAAGEAGRALPRQRGRLAAVLNRRLRRAHHGSGDVEEALGLPVEGSVREDAPGARRALERRLPLASVSRGAGGDVRALAQSLETAAGPAPAHAMRARVRLPAWGALRRALGAAG